MKTTKPNLKCEVKSTFKIVKVVELKRFKPDTHVGTVFKPKKFDKHPIINLNNTTNIHTEDQDVKIENHQDSAIDVNKNSNKTVTEILRDHRINSSSCQTVSTVRKKSKIKFNNCSHTPEELSKLIQHHDETLVKVGDTFESREAFKQYLYDNAKTWLYYYVCRNSKKKSIAYNCLCMPYMLKPRDIVIRRQKKRTTACPCKIRLTIDEDTKKVVVYYVCNHHDHCLTETAFYHFPHAKHLPQEVKDVFLDLAYFGLDLDLIQKYIHSLVGVTIKRRDIWSYAYKFKRKILQRILTADRKKYIEDLITKIRNSYDVAVDIKIEGNSDEDCKIVAANNTNKSGRSKWRKAQGNGQKVCQDVIKNIDDDVNMNTDESENNILDDVINSNCVDLKNDDVIVQYINEEGILCDQDGEPVTNSPNMMQLINNYEYVMSDSNVREDGFLEEGAVFSELVENIDDDIYPLNWDSIQPTKPVIEKGEVNENESYVDITVDPLATDTEVAEAASVETIRRGPRSGPHSSITILSNDLYTYDKRLSPTRESPALYAEMDVFKKYYFVDHRYIKCDGDNSKDRKRSVSTERRIDRRGGIDTGSAAHVEEYIKAPNFICYPTPLRSCLGHEHLPQLSDSEVILPGAKFLTHGVFLTYINERANRWCFYYSLVESGKWPEYYVYKCVFGRHRVSRNAYRAKGLRKRAKLTTQCPCQIRLRRLESEPVYLTVLYSCNHHDHALDARTFTAQPHSRRLPDHLKEEIKDMLALGAAFDVLRKYVMSETGLRVYGKYFHNVKVKMLKTEETREFTEERIVALTKKIKDLEDIYGSTSKENPQFRTSQGQAKKRRLQPLQNVDQREDQYTRVVPDEPATQTQEYYRIANTSDIAEEICIVEADSLQTRPLREHSRLETRLQNISSHEETLLKVKKLQESVRCEYPRNTYEVVQLGSIVRVESSKT